MTTPSVCSKQNDETEPHKSQELDADDTPAQGITLGAHPHLHGS